MPDTYPTESFAPIEGSAITGPQDGLIIDDHLVGTADAPDYLDGGAGNDTLEGLGGGDELAGGLGNDSVSSVGAQSGSARNSLYGFEGNDTLESGDAADWLDGGSGDDLLAGGGGRDTLEGGTGADTLIGGAGDDQFNPGDGTADDVLTGGAGEDNFEIYLGGLFGEETTGFGNDTITDFGDGDLFQVHVTNSVAIKVSVDVTYTESDTLFTFGAGTGYESTVLLQNYILPEWDLPYNNEIYGYYAVHGTQDGLVIDDHLVGTADAPDYLDGGAGNDTLEGLGGGDELAGGLGNDSVSSVGAQFGSTRNSLYGFEGNDTLESGDAADWLDGGSGDDLLEGGDGRDTLEGGTGADTLIGGSGDDQFNPGDGTADDVLTGGAGEDNFEIYLGGLFGDETTGFGNDTITDFGDGDIFQVHVTNSGVFQVSVDVTYTESDTLFTFGAGTGYESSVLLQNYILPEWDLPYNNEIYGYYAVHGTQDGLVIDDHLVGTADAPDFLDGGAGNDTIEGLGGYDELTGGSGNDSLSSVGGTGGTPFYPQSSLYGDEGNDTLISGDATDVLEGGTGDDLLIGGGGDDNLNGDFGADTLDGGTGDDTLTAGDGAFDDVLTGGEGEDRFEIRLGYYGSDELAFGNDTITDFGDGDRLSVQGFGVHEFSVDVTYTDTDTLLTFGLGTDYESSVLLENYILPEWDLPYGGYASGVYGVRGDQDGLVIDDHLIGTPGDLDELLGGAGNDTIEGLGGHDVLSGGLGDDSVSSVGGTGGTRDLPESWLYGDEGNDTLVSGDATDSLEGGTGDDLLIGGGGDDILNGDLGADTMDGGTGDDTLTAGEDASDDVMTGGEGEDDFTITMNWNGETYIGFGHDVITDFGVGDHLRVPLFGPGSVSLDARYEGNDTLLTFGAGTSYESTLLLQGYVVPESHLAYWNGEVTTSFALRGTEDGIISEDLLIGGVGEADVLNGGGGNDALFGFGGGDELSGGAGDDLLSTMGSTVGEPFNVLNGNAGEDTLEGGDAEDHLYGGADNDLLSGGGGDDVIHGDEGEDTVVYEGNFSDYDVTDLGLGAFTVVSNRAEDAGTDQLLDVEAVQFADGTLTAHGFFTSNPPETVTDSDNTRPWESYVDTFDADGARIMREMTFDDGRVAVTHYTDDVRREQVVSDLGDTQSWESRTTTYDADGVILSSDTVYDDGRAASTTFVDGVRSTHAVEDLADAFVWNSTERLFDAEGELTESQTLYDDGRSIVTSYEDGVRSHQENLDLEDAYSWSSISIAFDENGDRVSRTMIYDDGSQTVTNYADDLLVS